MLLLLLLLLLRHWHNTTTQHNTTQRNASTALKMWTPTVAVLVSSFGFAAPKPGGCVDTRDWLQMMMFRPDPGIAAAGLLHLRRPRPRLHYYEPLG